MNPTANVVDQASNAISGAMLTMLIVGGIILIITLVFLIWFIYEIISINKNTSKTVTAINNLAKQLRNGAPSKASSPIDGAEELMKYKNLMDSGVITESEYAAKKAQILQK